jgi:hypothetical protein
MHHCTMHSWTKKAEISLDLIRGRRVLADLQMQSEMEADLERMIRLTPEQLEEEWRSSGINPADAAQLLARAIEEVDEAAGQPAAAPERNLADELDDLIDEAWVRRIAAMTPVEIRELAEGSSLTDEQAESIRRRAKAWIEERKGREPTH